MKRSIQTSAALGQDRNGAATSLPSAERSRQGSLATPKGTVEAPGNGHLRFAALIRVSTEQQKETGESLRTQTADLKAAVVQLGGEIVEWYGGQEHATPGHEKKELNRLLQNSQKQPKPFDAFIVAHPDRWSRDNSASRDGLEVFRQQGIRFYVGTTEYDLFNPEHDLFLGMSAVIGQYLARNQMSKSMKNRIKRAERGIPAAGKLPFGRTFKWHDEETRENGHWEIDPEKQRVIQDCAKRYLAGEAIKDLATEYRMNAANLHKVLNHVSGTKWQIEFKSKPLNIHEVVEMDIPALLDKDTIAAIRAKADANRTFTHGHIKYEYVFSRMISCAHCGYAMTGQANHNGRRYYRHVHTERDKLCPGPARKMWIPADEIEDNAMRHLFEAFGNPAAVAKAIEDATPNDTRIREAQDRLASLNEDLTKLERSRQRILDLVVKGTISQTSADSQLQKLKEREQKLGGEAAKFTAELAHIPSPDSVKNAGMMIAGQFRRYTNAKAIATKQLANSVFEEMSNAEKRKLCQMVFSGTTPDGKRMGIWISWSNEGKAWRYEIHGQLLSQMIDGQVCWPWGPRSKEMFGFGSPSMQEDLVAKSASHSPGTIPLSLRCAGPIPQPWE